ncbi:MAG: hypothetical protein QNJ47_28190 [Nostocaceae cyanobacterium]|nr:hypothetical protein [Nostocaceae cyanobacterium]
MKILNLIRILLIPIAKRQVTQALKQQLKLLVETIKDKTGCDQVNAESIAFLILQQQITELDTNPANPDNLLAAYSEYLEELRNRHQNNC